ncbi:hypothetical protein HAX54_039603 [Datura stramonium]|uniref:Aquaporin n=1 Tax=Datura stramonium TaxID=4076 RepID=A0ABS8VQ60_DATST|nr:hypothetical protein [Datura stramonium]
MKLDQCGGVGILGIAWAFGEAYSKFAYCTAGISGGHINPAVTFGLFLARKAFQKAYYVIRYGGGVNTLNDGYSTGTGLGAEIITLSFLFTLCLLLLILRGTPETLMFLSFGAAVIYGKDKAWDDQWILG